MRKCTKPHSFLLTSLIGTCLSPFAGGLRDIRELVTFAKCCSDFVTELALEHGRNESWFCAVAAGDAVFGRWTYWLVSTVPFWAVCLLFINPFMSCFCACMVSVSPHSVLFLLCYLWGGLRSLQEAWVLYRLKFFADEAACIVHQILRCCVPPLYVFCLVLNSVHSGDRNCCYYILIFSFIAPTFFIFLLGEPSLWSADV